MSSLKRLSISPFKMKFSEKGVIKDIKKIIVRIDGLPSCLNGQIVDFGDQNRGIIMGYTEDDVLALMLGDENRIRMGQQVTSSSEPFTIPVGVKCLGRMFDALGNPMDNAGPFEAEAQLPVFGTSPTITERAPVDAPLYSGTKVIDVMVPLGKGQRELILGDRMTGKTAVAVDAMLNQKGRSVCCIYCCVGKSASALEKVVSLLSEKKSLEYSTVIAATDNSSVGEQYIAPFTAATIGEHLMRKGRDVLVVFDDLTKHAWSYRQLSLLLERPPGREAYPGDIFYIHTQLMERAGRLSPEAGGGSMTFLGIADTLQGDLTGYIPSNLISMCDGQVVLTTALFSEGVRPAIDFGLSMSIIGGRAQPPILRALSSNLRQEYTQYAELLRLSRLQSGLSAEAEHLLKRGKAIVAVLQQGLALPASPAEEVLQLYALRENLLNDLSPQEMTQFKEDIGPSAQKSHPELFTQLDTQPELSPSMEALLREALKAYFDSHTRAAATA